MTMMAQIVNLNLTTLPNSRLCITTHRRGHRGWVSLRHKPLCSGKVSCFFPGNRRQENARKALEIALDGKKIEFDKWNKEIKEREEVRGGGGGAGAGAGRGGWFGGGGGWFGGSFGDHFWHEAQQASLTVLGIVLMYLIFSKGEVMFAVFVNPLLLALRGTRNGFTFMTSWLNGGSKALHSDLENTAGKVHKHVSAKDSVVRKWGSD